MLFGLNIYFMEVSCLRIFLLYLWREYKSKGNRRAALGFLRLLGHFGLIGLLGVIGLLGLLGLLVAKTSNESKRS